MKITYSHHKIMSLNILSVMLLFLSNLFLIQPATATTVTKCGRYDSVSITSSSNTYKVNNNIWNDSSNSQCVQVNDTNGNFNVTSSTHNKASNSAPGSYTFIDKGCHWGTCTSNTKSGMPKQVSKILNASSNWSTTQPTTGIYNIAYDVWFNKTSITSGQPDGAELMIWLAYMGNIQPLGSRLATVSIAGTTWDVWGDSINNIISYVRTSNTKSVCNLNLKSFITDAVSRKYIQSSWYLISVQAGFEIWQNGKGLASSSFSALVE